MEVRTALSILNNQWLIERSAAVQLLDIWSLTLNGTVKWDHRAALRSEEREHDNPLSSVITSLGSANVKMAPDYSYDISNFLKNGGFEGAAVAIIPVVGPMMKSDYCGTPGTSTLTNLTKIASATESVQTIIYVCDSPGGSVDGNEVFGQAIKGSSKRTIALVTGMMASANYWIGSHCDEMYATSKTDQIGCIGTMCSLVDNTEAMKQRGYVVREYYANESADKNLAWTKAIGGDGKLLIEETLDPLNDVFLSTVKANRGEKLKKEALTGKTYIAEKAVELGLIDGIKSLEDVLEEVTSIGYSYAGKSQFSNKNKINNMNRSELRAKHPELHREVFKAGAKKGAENELERVKSLLVFHAADPARVIKAIQEGEQLTPSLAAELTLKLNNKGSLDKLDEEKPDEVTTTETTAKTDSERKVEAAAAELKKRLGITDKTV